MKKSEYILFHGDKIINCYSYQGIYYFIHFPYEWVTNIDVMSGPEHCEKCQKHGFYKDIFIGYCVDCANNIYNLKRGHGFINGIEQINKSKKNTSAYNTYLKHLYNVNKM